jgi:hypothetical protein
MRAQSLIAILAATIIGLTSGLGQAAAQPFQDLCARDVFQADGTLGSAPRKLEAACRFVDQCAGRLCPLCQA